MDLKRRDPFALRLDTRSAKARADELIDSDDAQDRVQALAPYTLYCLVMELGLPDGVDLVHMASGQQLQAFIDFDGWTRDRPDLDRFAGWLALVMQGSDEQVEAFRSNVDPELLGLFLQGNLQIYLYEDEDDATALESLDAAIESSPDGVYALVMPDDAELAALMRLTLMRLYASDQNWTRQLIQAARHEIQSVLEEAAYQVRNGRVADNGFLSFEEALEVYQYVEPGRLLARAEHELAQPTENDAVDVTQRVRVEGTVHLPAVFASPLLQVTDSASATFLGQALQQLVLAHPGRVDSLLLMLSALVNRVHIAEPAAIGDLEQLEKSFLRTLGLLNIGLEFLSRRRLEIAVTLLGRWSFKQILQAGNSLVLKLAGSARSLSKRGNLGWMDDSPLSLCDENEAALIAGLTAPRPRPSDDGEREFARLEEVERAASTLTRLAFKEMWAVQLADHTPEDLEMFFENIPTPRIEPRDLRFDHLLATHGALLVLSQDRDLRPLRADELADFCRAHVTTEGISDALRGAMGTATRAPVPTEETADRIRLRWIDDVARRLIDEYGQLTPDAFKEVQFLPDLILLVE